MIFLLLHESGVKLRMSVNNNLRIYHMNVPGI